jgi:hypothetical protein
MIGLVPKIERIVFCRNGAVVVFDEQGQQVTQWQTNLLCDHLQKMLDAGVIGPNIPVETALGEGIVHDWARIDPA